MRDAVGAAQNAASTASNTAAGYGAQASTIGSQLVPFESRQLQNPSGMSQQDIGQQLTAGLAGAGGATSGLAGAASKDAATSRNPMGFSSALDSAARSRDAAAAKTSEGIAANNANVKLGQQDTAGKTLSGLYGMNVQGQNEAARNVTGDINAETDANKTGWMQNMTQLIAAVNGSGGQGISSLAKMAPGMGCWIAAAVYDGWLDPRTIKARGWLFGPFRAKWYGRLVTDLYLKFGERTAGMIERHPILRRPFRKLFDLALRRANGSN